MQQTGDGNSVAVKALMSQLRGDEDSDEGSVGYNLFAAIEEGGRRVSGGMVGLAGVRDSGRWARDSMPNVPYCVLSGEEDGRPASHNDRTGRLQQLS